MSVAVVPMKSENGNRFPACFISILQIDLFTAALVGPGLPEAVLVLAPQAILAPQALASMMGMAVRAALAICFTLASLVLVLVLLPRQATLYCWGLAELVFLLHYYKLLQRLHLSAAARQAAPKDHSPEATREKLLSHLQSVDDIRGCMLQWFINAHSWDQIKRHNLLQLFAYAVWYKSLDQLEAEGRLSEVEQLLQRLEVALGQPVPEGYNPQLRFMCHLWDPVRHIYRPLLFYAVMELLALLCHVALLAAGFRQHELGGISYYTYNLGPQRMVEALSAPLAKSNKHVQTATAATNGAPSSQPPAANAQDSSSSTDSEQVPLVFLHGVGAGLLPYLCLVFNFASLGRPMVLPESKHVSMRLVSWLPTVDDMADATAAILAAHGVKQAVVSGHSYGTMVAARLAIKYEAIVHSLCLMDPVCFAMFLPDLVRNFLYNWHNSGCLVLDIIMGLVSTELHCAANFSCHFFWDSINLWAEHIPERTLVVLSGRDILTPTAHVHKWLCEHTHAEVLHQPDMPHAAVLVNIDWQNCIKAALEVLISKPAGRLDTAPVTTDFAGATNNSPCGTGTPATAAVTAGEGASGTLPSGHEVAAATGIDWCQQEQQHVQLPFQLPQQCQDAAPGATLAEGICCCCSSSCCSSISDSSDAVCNVSSAGGAAPCAAAAAVVAAGTMAAASTVAAASTIAAGAVAAAAAGAVAPAGAGAVELRLRHVAASCREKDRVQYEELAGCPRDFAALRAAVDCGGGWAQEPRVCARKMTW